MELLPFAAQLHRPSGVPYQTTESQPPLTDVITALERATQTLKTLPSSTDPSHLRQSYYSLCHAHHHIGSLLAQFDLHHPTAEKSSVSVGGGGGGGDEDEDEPMADEGGASEEVDSLNIVDKVEEGMRGCALQPSKRRKRPLSPNWVAQRPANYNAQETGLLDQRERLRLLDLVFQFHG